MVLLSFMNANSQESRFSVGVKAGLNVSNVDMEYFDTDAKASYRFGVVTEYDLRKSFFLRSGLDVNSKGFKSELTTMGDINGDGLLGDYGVLKSSWNMVYLQLPVMVGYKIDLNEFKINFVAGGYFSYGIGGKVTSRFNGFLATPSGQQEDYAEKAKDNTFSSDLLKRFDAGLLGGVGAEYKSLTFNLGYEYGLSDISQGATSIHNRNAFFTIGYRFF